MSEDRITEAAGRSDSDPPIVPVSVIVPCFNCAETIRRAVDSVVSQTVRPVEIILVDDCSPSQKTAETLRELQARYAEWIILLTTARNMGPGSARNVGWKKAVGKYVAFLDADDIWHPEKLERQFRWMEENPEFILSSHDSVVVSSSRDLADYCTKGPLNAREVKPRSQVLKNRHITRTVMVKRDIATKFEEGKRYAEDYLLWSEIGLLEGRMAYLGAVLAGSFREPFSSGGLSGNLWKMQVGGWRAQHSLYRSRSISGLLFIASASYGLVRFGRRLLIASVRRIRGPSAQ